MNSILQNWLKHEIRLECHVLHVLLKRTGSMFGWKPLLTKPALLLTLTYLSLLPRSDATEIESSKLYFTLHAVDNNFQYYLIGDQGGIGSWRIGRCQCNTRCGGHAKVGFGNEIEDLYIVIPTGDVRHAITPLERVQGGGSALWGHGGYVWRCCSEEAWAGILSSNREKVVTSTSEAQDATQNINKIFVFAYAIIST